MQSAELTFARAIAEDVHARGGRALVVGGYVRDQLLGHPSKDIDLEVFGVPADDLKALLARFGAVNTVGESFTVFKVQGLDVSLPRRESKVGRGHKGFVVHGDPFLPFDEAARRRDFTINAIGWDPRTGEYLDPHGGRADLEARVLRMVDARTFGEDSLRVLRALQFAARFGCRVDEATAGVCRATPLDDLPAERVWGELEKLLLRSPRPSVGLHLARDLDVVGRLWPTLEALARCPQDPEWHPEGDVWTHTCMVVDEAATRKAAFTHPEQVALMLGALLHDIGKPLVTAEIDGRIKSPGHEGEGVPLATALLDAWQVHTLEGYPVRAQVLALVAWHMLPGAWWKAPEPVSDGAFRRLARKVDMVLLARLSEADCNGRGGTFDCSFGQWFLDRVAALGVEHAPPAPLLLGRHLIALGVAPGPRMGEILKAVYEQQLDGAVTTLEEAIDAARGNLKFDS
ncbi:multifunctional CCA protein [Luteitalea sp. TBR-22]|uniref:CCA tRNA nucleotidyltransferase n=1 Tax=Luteitalea sp. TBR-22 TaxID=2802971 RepID=UPI001AF06036|nr:HD domain-containing protein [Luteitalea sp. TBR-22]BCS35314.1 multifunctional CCA protein [Luteitalea sp. TBR-22]